MTAAQDLRGVDIMQITEVTESQPQAVVQYTQQQAEVDYLFRMYTSAADPKAINIIFSKTEHFRAGIDRILNENNVLKYILKNCWKYNEYLQENINCLQGVITKEEFLSKVKRFARPFIEWDDADLVFAAEVVLSVLGEPLNSGELSELLDANPQIVERALSASALVQIAANQA